MPRKPAAPSRLQDVAQAAGVHPSTVSRILNGSGGRVTDATRQRVIETASRLRYRPNALARGLKTATTGALGLLVPSLRNPVFTPFIRGAFHRAFERDFVVLLAEETGEGQAQSAYERLVDEGRIEGLLLATARLHSPLLEQLTTRGIPHVFVNRRQPQSRRNISMTEEDAGRLAGRHLLSLGHRRVAHLAGPADLDTARRRTRGFNAELREAGVRPRVRHASYDEPAAFEAVQQLLSTVPPPTALFVSNFNQAIGALAGIRHLGLDVPGEISLIACDDDPLLEYLEVPLTAVRMPLWELGVAAVDALLDQIAGGRLRDVQVDAPPLLVVRGSTNVPARQDGERPGSGPTAVFTPG
jgi:LacI family transcriptional regulator